MKRLAAIYERKGALFVTAAHRTNAGFWIDDEHVFVLNQPTPEELGRAIELALARSRNGVPTPLPSTRLDKPLLKAAGVGSWATFMKLSKHVRVAVEGDLLKITPYRNLGSKEGFVPQSDMTIPSSASASSVGETIAELFDQAA